MSYEKEAISWLSNDSQAVIAPNAFHTNEKSLEVVRRLYAAGAKKIIAIVRQVTTNKEDRLVMDETCDTIEVVLPSSNRGEILKLIQSLQPDNWEKETEDDVDLYEDDESYSGATVTLWWD